LGQLGLSQVHAGMTDLLRESEEPKHVLVAGRSPQPLVG
jgi:hypothetical protein